MKHTIPDDIHAVPNSPKLNAGRILMITADGTEDQEFFYPYYRFSEAGYQVDVATPDGGKFKGKNGAGLQETMKIEDVEPNQYAMLYIPGGKAPAKLKKEKEAVRLVKEFCATGKPIAAICHGPQLLAEAGVINGRGIAAWPECQEEVEEAGAKFRNEACVHDGQFITGRWPADLPEQMAEVMKVLGAGAGTTRIAA